MIAVSELCCPGLSLVVDFVVALSSCSCSLVRVVQSVAFVTTGGKVRRQKGSSPRVLHDWDSDCTTAALSSLPENGMKQNNKKER